MLSAISCANIAYVLFIPDTNHDELDGWITRNKAFNDQDNAQMSSSELLHPVESSENVFPPMWRPSSSTSLFTIENQKVTITVI